MTTDVRGFRVDTSEGELLRFGEVEITLKASADRTGGVFTIFEESEPVDTPLHVHENEDELFYVCWRASTSSRSATRSIG